MTSDDMSTFTNITALRLYAIYDSQAQAYLRPFTAQGDGDAIRAFMDSCADEQSSPMGQHPGDYTLYFVGRFLEASAHLENQENVRLISGLEALTLFRHQTLQRQRALQQAHDSMDPDRDDKTADLFEVPEELRRQQEQE